MNTWLVNLLAPILLYLGVPLPQRKVINFLGSGVSVTDNPAKNETDVTIAGGGTLAGDVVGSLGDNEVSALQGVSVVLGAAANGQVLGIVGGEITNAAVSGDVVLSTTMGATVEGIQNNPVSAGALTAGQSYVWNGSALVPTSPGPSRFGDCPCESTTLTTPTVIRYFNFNPAAFPAAGLTMTVVCELVVASSSDVAVLTLWDATDGGVEIAQFTAGSTTPVLASTSIHIGTPGIGLVGDSDRTYYWTLARSGGSASDAVTVLSAYIEVQN